MYSENFALKVPNETISFINHYINNNIDKTVEEIYVFSDKNFTQRADFYGFFTKVL
jgi:hypothetical protein